MKILKVLSVVLLGLFIASCNQTDNKNTKIETDENGVAILSDAQIENLVKRSYQYVAMYNTNQKMALAELGVTTKGYNKGMRKTELLDHSEKFIARPNNDVLYQLAMLDLRKDAIVFEIPAIESRFVSMMATGYDHYVTIPMSTVDSPLDKPMTLLFYTERTEGYNGERIEGIDRICEMTGDFVSLVMRVMPHANEPERYARIVEQINAIKGISLSEFLGKPRPETDEIQFPAYGETDADIYENNLLEVMQFVFNHTTFDPNFELDKEVLAAYASLGIEPGKEYNPENTVKIDGKKFREISIKVRDEEIAKMNNTALIDSLLPTLYQPKGKAGLESLLLVSVVGPIGQPSKEAMYPPITTADGSPMNALNDYVIHMTKDELPPANAFWSFTLYDAVKGFFIPNDRKKYSVGENAGRKLNKEGGIDIYIAAEKPVGVPDENWLPINREDLEITITLRIYGPDLEKMKTWKAPNAVKLEQ